MQPKKEVKTKIEELGDTVAKEITRRLIEGLCPLCGEKGCLDSFGGAICSKHGPYNLQVIKDTEDRTEEWLREDTIDSVEE